MIAQHPFPPRPHLWTSKGLETKRFAGAPISTPPSYRFNTPETKIKGIKYGLNAPKLLITFCLSNPPPSLFLCEGGRYPTQLCKKGGGECFVTQPTDQLRGEVAQCKLTASYLPMLTGHLVLIRTSDCAHLAIHL